MTGLGCGYGDELGFRIEDINVGWGREVQEAAGHMSLDLRRGLGQGSPCFQNHLSASMQIYSHQWYTT